jgi:hypothetical protein
LERVERESVRGFLKGLEEKGDRRTRDRKEGHKSPPFPRIKVRGVE